VCPVLHRHLLSALLVLYRVGQRSLGIVNDTLVDHSSFYYYYYYYCCYYLARQPSVGQGLLIHPVSRSHSTHTTVGSTPLDERSACRRDLSLTTHNIHDRQTSMPLCGIRTHNLSRPTAAELRLGPRGHCDRQSIAVDYSN